MVLTQAREELIAKPSRASTGCRGRSSTSYNSTSTTRGGSSSSWIEPAFATSLSRELIRDLHAKRFGSLTTTLPPLKASRQVGLPRSGVNG